MEVLCLLEQRGTECGLVLVEESHDMNAPQTDIAQVLASLSESNRQFIVVDGKQSILWFSQREYFNPHWDKRAHNEQVIHTRTHFWWNDPIIQVRQPLQALLVRVLTAMAE